MNLKSLHKPLIQQAFDEHTYCLLSFGNQHLSGFKNKLLCSNARTQSELKLNTNSICFINYDYKNKLEHFINKNKNPISFPEIACIEAEKQVFFNELILESDSATNTLHTFKLKACVTKNDYVSTVNKLKQHIQQGDIYEINYCISFEAHDVEIDPLTIYKKLNSISKASYSTLAKFNHQYIICSSPELYLSKRGHHLISKPIKGTAKRGKTKEEDDTLKQTLQQSLKEQTENVMIVDVVRNDFSRLAKKGTVNVDSLFNIETYEQVHQMVSTVSCEVKENTTFNDILKATFPMASMTGAPKIRAMQLIDDYELYNRGPYSGALGYVEANGDFDLNVLIRSIFYDEQKRYLSFSVGSAITALCDPEEEYEECLLKAKAMMDVLS
jgi:para-aminobenzoate synthetase component 1